MSSAVTTPVVLLSTLGKMTLNVNAQANGLVRTGVSLRMVGENRQEVMGSQDHETKVRAMAHRRLLINHWVSQGWEERQSWMDKQAKSSNARARSAPTRQDWGPRYTPPAAPALPAAQHVSVPARHVPLPVPARTTIPLPAQPTAPSSSVTAGFPLPGPRRESSPLVPQPAQVAVPPRSSDGWPGVESLVGRAVGCRECFERGEVRAPFITVAQPRWVPPGYWQQALRVVVLMINPGESGGTPGARLFLERMAEYRAGRMDLRTLLDFQRTTMMQWGNPPGRFARFYFDSLGLSVDQVAFANVAWCGTKGNQYPGSVVGRCFHRHTLPLLRALAPHVVIASGSKTHHYLGTLRAELPGVTVVPTLHYAHRGGGAVEAAEVARLRQLLAENRARTASAAHRKAT